MNRNVSDMLGTQFGIWKERLLSRKLKQYGGTTADENEIEKFGLSCVTSLVEDDAWEK